MSFLLERDALNGKSGSGFITINGENHQMFGMKKFQSDAEFQEEDFKVVGTNLVQTKTTGVKALAILATRIPSPTDTPITAKPRAKIVRFIVEFSFLIIFTLLF